MSTGSDIEHYVATQFGDEPGCVCQTMEFTARDGEWSVDIDQLDFSLPLKCRYSQFLHHLKNLEVSPDKCETWHYDGYIKTCRVFIPQLRDEEDPFILYVSTDYGCSS